MASVGPESVASGRKGASREHVGPGDRVGEGGRYELRAQIGTGGMGTVYRAFDHVEGIERAVKVLSPRVGRNPDFVRRFRREATAAAQVSHPNVVALTDVSPEGTHPVYLVMELLQGETLSTIVRREGRLPWSRVHGYLDQLAAGLGAAHAEGIVHRDVKPGNCLVQADGSVKLLDFGIAKLTGRDHTALTKVGEIIGTYSYMAPEQIRGEVDARSDIYALGVVTFRLLTGRLPFSEGDQEAVLRAHLTAPAPAPSRFVGPLPPGVDALVLRMLAKQPHRRFADTQSLQQAIASVERDGTVPGDVDVTCPEPGVSSSDLFEEIPTRAVMRAAGDPDAETRADAVPAGLGASDSTTRSRRGLVRPGPFTLRAKLRARVLGSAGIEPTVQLSPEEPSSMDTTLEVAPGEAEPSSIDTTLELEPGTSRSAGSGPTVPYQRRPLPRVRTEVVPPRPVMRPPAPEVVDPRASASIEGGPPSLGMHEPSLPPRRPGSPSEPEPLSRSWARNALALTVGVGVAAILLALGWLLWRGG